VAAISETLTVMTAAKPDVAHVRAFNRFHTRWVGALAEGLHATDHSLTEARVLYELGRAEATPTSALRERLRMDSGHLSRVLAELERRGLLERRTAEGDGRRRDLVLTPAGRSASQLLDELATRDVEARLAPLGAVDRKRVVEAMAEVRRLLDEPEIPSAV
jgi:DNA-binding MarR family transcriptional regulator